MPGSDIFATVALIVSVANLSFILYGIWRLRD